MTPKLVELDSGEVHVHVDSNDIGLSDRFSKTGNVVLISLLKMREALYQAVNGEMMSGDDVLFREY